MTKPLTNQQIFNRVAKHLLAQGRRAMSNGACVYRGPGGTKCAVGCIIPDELYSPEFEGNNVEGIFKAQPKLWNLLAHRGGMTLLAHLQEDVHDECPPRMWPSALRSVAVKHGLNTKVLP